MKTKQTKRQCAAMAFQIASTVAPLYKLHYPSDSTHNEALQCCLRSVEKWIKNPNRHNRVVAYHNRILSSSAVFDARDSHSARLAANVVGETIRLVCNGPGESNSILSGIISDAKSAVNEVASRIR